MSNTWSCPDFAWEKWKKFKIGEGGRGWERKEERTGEEMKGKGSKGKGRKNH